MSSTTKTDSLGSRVPTLDGSNYRVWVIQMSNFLRTKGLWLYVTGGHTRPGDATPTVRYRDVEGVQQRQEVAPTAAAVIDARKEQLNWDTKDDEANGLIMLYTVFSLHGQQGATSYRTWRNLATMFELQGAASVFNDFQKLINFRISGNRNPTAEIDSMAELAHRLHANNVPLSEFIRSMLLLNALPQSLQTVTTIALQVHNAQELNFTDIRNDVITEWERKALPSANRLSAVKRKGPDPSYRSQQRRFEPSAQPDRAPAEGSSNRGNSNRGRGKGRGGGQNKRKRGSGASRKQDGDKHDHGHSHLASSAYIEEFPPLSQPSQIAIQPSRAGPSTTTVASFSRDGIAYRKVDIADPVYKTEHAAKKAKKMFTPSIYPEVAKSREMADNLDVPKVPRNLKVLEKVASKNAPTPQIATSSKVTLDQRISTPDEQLIWATDDEELSRQVEAMNDYLGSDEDPLSDNDVPEAVMTGWGDTEDVDMEIANAAGFGTGPQFFKERQVPSYFSSNSDSLVQQPLLAASNVSTVDLENLSTVQNKFFDHCKECERCKRRLSGYQDWIMDSGASKHFTAEMSDFTEYTPIKDGPILQTAAKKTPLQIAGEGTIFLSHTVVDSKGRSREQVSRFYPVYYVPGMSGRLLSMGELLVNGYTVHGNADYMDFHKGSSRNPALRVVPHMPGQTIYWLHAKSASRSALVTKSSINSDTYDMWHKRFGHPSKQVLQKAQRQVNNFPQNLTFPEKVPVCRGCAEGKMHSRSFPESLSRASKPFQRIHSDLKSFPVESYHRYKYLISFFDDCSSHAWIALLKRKEDALDATKNFVAAVKTQFKAHVQEWMSDAGGEYKSNEFDAFLKGQGIKILQSVPHQPQQNGRAERFNRTIMDKAQAMRFDACLPQSWWEFAVLHAVHLYNRTPIQRLEWVTPYERIFSKKPDVSHFRVFGSAAYVFIHEDIRANKLAPKSELMTFLGYPEGVKGFLFMRSPNNTLFTSATALFDESVFPKCPDMRNDLQRRGFMPVGNNPAEDPSNEGGYIPTEAGDDDDQNDHNPGSSIPKRRTDVNHDGDDDQIPPDAPKPAPQQGGENVPVRRSGRHRETPARPGNVYGEKRTPTDILRDVERQTYWRKTVEGSSRPRNQKNPVGKPEISVPGPSSQPSPSATSDTEAPLDDEHATLSKLAREGGVKLMNFLLAKAVPPHELLPNPANVRDWTFRDIMRMPEAQRKEWKDACREELESLNKRDVFELCKLPPGRKAIKNRWVFDIKSDGRKKARLVAKGFSQIEGIDYDEIFSPVVRFETVRMLFATAALENWQISALDVKTAFLYGKLDEEIYMEQPEGFKVKGQEDKVVRLRRAIYGLKQAALAWWKELDQSVKQLGFKRLYADAGIFVCRHGDGTILVMLAYVDDILFLGPKSSLLLQKKKLFMERWECRDLGDCKEFLRMRVQRKNGKIYLDQTTYLQKVVERFGMTNSRYASTPLPAGYKPEPNPGPADAKLRSEFQSVIGSLLYIMLGTRPDIAYAVTKMSQFAANPSREHLDKALYICRYLAGTSKYALVYDGPSNKGLLAYTDSDWASDPIKRRSVTGYFFKLADGIISWQSRSQKTVALSSTEAEYMALSDCSRQAVWMKSVFTELGMPLATVPICGDNQGSIFISSNPVQERRSKHIDIRYHYVREMIEERQVAIYFVEGSHNPADLFTKNLGQVKFEYFRKQLGLEFYSS